MIESKNKFINIHGVQFKLWLYFFLMSCVVLSVLWTMQLAFYAFSNQSLQMDEVERTGDKILKQFVELKSEYEMPEFKKAVQQTAYATGTNIVFFCVDYEVVNDEVIIIGEVTELVASSSILNSPDDENELVDISIGENYFKMASTSERFTYVSTTDSGNYLVYGANISLSQSPTGENVLLFVSSPVTLSEIAGKAFRRQLFASSVICIGLSFLLTWIISSRISSPIQNFSKGARRLAKGDYKVRFKGNGMSEIEDLAQTLNYATQEIGKTEALRREFLANVSHDLRTPLTMVKAYAEMIRDISGNDAAKRASHSQVIIDEADRLANLVNDILELSKLQSGTKVLEKSEIDLAVYAKNVLERFDIYSEKSDYKFNLECEDDCVVFADGAKIEQVLYNLIGNAMNYTGEDKTVKVYIARLQDKVKVEISDSGKGIAPEEIDSVWDRYYRASQTKRNVVGTGLGLSIVKNILLAHSAQYGIESSLGKGSKFWFELKAHNKI